MVKNKILLFALIFIISKSINSQHIFDFDTNNNNNQLSEEIYDTFVLESGVLYNLKIEGTFSVQSADQWIDPCNEIELTPLFPSPNNSQTDDSVCCDVKYAFSYSRENDNCEELLVYSEASERIQITLDNGDTWFPATNDETFNEDHIYNYQIIGQGFPIGVNNSDPQNSDDNGILRFTIREFYEIPDFTIYPNPTHDYLYIENPNLNISDINLIDMLGHKINLDYTTDTVIEIDTSILAKAMYIVQIITFEEVIYERLIID